MATHIPVLAKEVLDALAITPGAHVLDGTLGLGGHAGLMLEAGATVVGFDRDARNLELAKANLERFGDRLVTINDSFGDVGVHDLGTFDGALFDLGFSSVHVDDPSRGFSFMHDGPLDMRYDTRQELTAEVIVNGWSKEDLMTILRQLGEEPFAPRIAKAIFDARREMRITTTGQLAAIVSSVVPRRGKSHPATKTFQALRIAVNDELGEVERGINATIDLLKPGGRIVVITFHSLEDRLIKTLFKTRPDLTIITKKPIVGTHEEVRANPRARSAKLRVAEKAR